MEHRYQPEPSFCDKSQGILKYNCHGNSFNVSSLNEFCKPVDSSGFAIKFVTEGQERYTINKQSYCVGTGSYLLLNGEKDAKVEIESKQNVKGICINISNAVVAEVVSNLARPDTPYSDPELASFFYTDHFLENQYQSVHTQLGAKLQQVSSDLKKNIFSVADINTGLFFDIAEKLVLDQAVVFKQLQSIRTVKTATRKDLCRRILRGREFMDSYFTQPITVEQIAKESAMSEFHFFRMFKTLTGVSPHQYILNKRLEAAGRLLKNRCTVSDTAIACGFADIYAFSKAFKKHYGIPPSSYYAG